MKGENMKKSLLLGCGNDRKKKVALSTEAEWDGELVTVDMNPDCSPDYVIDLAQHRCKLPFADSEFDYIGAYDVLEHWGAQGDWRAWFAEFAEYWRILKPGGQFGAIVPIGQDAIVDPGHTRMIHATWFLFLNQKFYEENMADGRPVTDYRWMWKKNFDIMFLEQYGNHHVAVLMVKA